MKKLALAFLLCLAFVPSASALEDFSFIVPRDRDDQPARSIQDVGVLVWHSTMTLPNGVLCGSTVNTVNGSSVAIYGVLMSSGVGDGGQYGIIRSTGLLVGTTSEWLVPAIMCSSPTRNTFVQYDPPIIAPDGFSAEVSSLNLSMSVFYRFLTTGTHEDVWFPREAWEGDKVYDAGFYGVKAASETNSGGKIDGRGTEATDFTSALQQLANTRSFFYGMAFSSATAGIGGASGAFVVVYDSNSGLGGTPLPAQRLLPPLFPHGWDTADQTTLKGVNIKFPWPLICQNGLTAQYGVATERIRYFKRGTRTVR